MYVFSRRGFLSATGALLISPAVVADEKSDRRLFLEEAIKDIKKDRADKEKTNAAAGTKGGMALFALPPRVISFLDWDYFYIDDVLTWASNTNNKLPAVRAPKGFVTDLASIPRPLWWALPRTGRYAYPAIVHDYLYWDQSTTKDVADDILMDSMTELGVDEVARKAIYAGVRTPLGQLAWDNNTEAKRSGEKRVLKKFPADSLVAWSDWKKKPGVF